MISELEWFRNAILTKHSPQLDGKYFGYHLVVDNTNVIYTGDTSILEPFLSYLNEGSILYIDTSVYYGMIHLKLEDTLIWMTSLQMEKLLQIILTSML